GRRRLQPRWWRRPGRRGRRRSRRRRQRRRRRTSSMNKFDEEKQMEPKSNIMTSTKLFVIVGAIFNCAFLVFSSQGAAVQKPDAAAASQPAQKQFDTPKQAADALIQVASNFDVAAAKEILGPDSEDIVASEDPVQDKNRAAEFAEIGRASCRERVKSRVWDG